MDKAACPYNFLQVVNRLLQLVNQISARWLSKLSLGMKTLFLILCALLFATAAQSQVSGALTDTSGSPLPFATVVLLKNSDSTIARSALSDEKGHFALSTAPFGAYVIKVTSIGYDNYFSPSLVLNSAHPSYDAGTIVLKTTGKQLSEVVIRSTKPLLQQEAGGITVNVQSSLLTKGSSALQVLQRSPGVTINPQNNSITLNGKSGVMVMLDGKLMRMSANQVVALLNGMSADDIDKIELLTTPPAKYDADGNAGLINIVTQKNKRRGTNGSVTVSAGYGKAEKASASINLSRNTPKVDLHGGYSNSRDHGHGELFASGTEDVSAVGGQTAFHYNGIGNPISKYEDADLGADIRINPKTAFGGSVYFSSSGNNNNSHNFGNYALRPDSDQLFNSHLNGLNHSYNLINSLYLESEISKGEKINFNADYIYYKNNGHTEVQSMFVDNNGNPVGANDSLYAPQQRDLSNTTIKVAVAKIDYAKQLSPKLKLEAGTKGTFTRTYSVSGIENLENGQWVPGSVGISNDLGTKEVIGAAYATFNVQFDTTASVTVGARYEYSHNSTDNASNPLYAIDRKLGKLFPSVFFFKKLTGNSELQLSYTQRITRPSFADLASYVTYNDPVSVFTGNPALKPTITNNLKIGYSYHDYLFSLLFSRDNNVILPTQISTGPSKGLVYLMPQNAPYQNNVTLQANIPVKISDWWESSYGFIGGFHQYKIDYTPQTFTKAYVAYSLNFAETFKLPKAFSFEISGYYNSSGYSSTSRFDGNGMLNFGMKKELPNNKGSFQLSVADLLMSGSYSSYIGSLTRDAFNSQVYVRYNGESRSFPIFKLTYYRAFGSANNKSTRKEDASRDERKRL